MLLRRRRNRNRITARRRPRRRRANLSGIGCSTGDRPRNNRLSLSRQPFLLLSHLL